MLPNSSTTPVPDIPRSGIQTVVLDSDVVAGLKFVVTLDTTKLPAIGTTTSHIRMSFPGDAGYSYVIDPSEYSYVPVGENATVAQVDTKDAATLSEAKLYTDSKFSGNEGEVFYERGADGVLKTSWSDVDSMFQVQFGINGFNELPNVRGIYNAPLSDLASAVWTLLNGSGGTDFLPPVVVSAINDGDGQHETNSTWFTGGNHSSNNNGSNGNKTAVNTLYKVLVDKSEIPAGAVSGYTDNVVALITNELMARNTLTLGRYVIRQQFAVKFLLGMVIVYGKVQRLGEDVRIYRDYGVQATAAGFNDTIITLDGRITQRKLYEPDTDNSGLYSEYPNAWAIVMQGTAGQFSIWIDPKQSKRHMALTESVMRGSTAGKVYGGYYC